MVKPPRISVLIPTLNEAAVLRRTLERAWAIPEVAEIIVGDGGSTDATCEIAEDAGCRVVTGARGRGAQLRAAAAAARENVVLMLHADTVLAPDAGRAAISTLERPGVVAGAFRRRFAAGAPWSMRGARFKSWLLLRTLGYVYGDQAIFLTRNVLARVGGVPDVPLMEDVRLCEQLWRLGRIELADGVAVTSWRKFEKLGVMRTYLLMARVLWGHRRGRSPEVLRDLYQR